MSFMKPQLNDNMSEDVSVHEGSSFVIDSSERLGGINNNSTVMSMSSKEHSM